MMSHIAIAIVHVWSHACATSPNNIAFSSYIVCCCMESRMTRHKKQKTKAKEKWHAYHRKMHYKARGKSSTDSAMKRSKRAKQEKIKKNPMQLSRKENVKNKHGENKGLFNCRYKAVTHVYDSNTVSSEKTWLANHVLVDTMLQYWKGDMGRKARMHYNTKRYSLETYQKVDAVPSKGNHDTVNNKYMYITCTKDSYFEDSVQNLSNMEKAKLHIVYVHESLEIVDHDEGCLDSTCMLQAIFIKVARKTAVEGNTYVKQNVKVLWKLLKKSPRLRRGTTILTLQGGM